MDQQIIKWQSIWNQGEILYKDVEEELKERRWNSAFMLSAKLLRVDNEYWSGLKYDELNNLITSAREDGDKLAKAERLANTRVVSNLLEAIKISESITSQSYIYEKAQEFIPKVGRKMLDLAQASLDERDANTAVDIARRIPDKTGLGAEVEDFIILADAYRLVRCRVWKRLFCRRNKLIFLDQFMIKHKN